MLLKTEEDLVAAALALGAEAVPGWSPQESILAKGSVRFTNTEAEQLRRAIKAGRDPLGNAFSRIRSPETRRQEGATYTPPRIVQANACLGRAPAAAGPRCRPGHRFRALLIRAARRFPAAELIGVELDPLAALMARANVAANGLQDRTEIQVGDYREAKLEKRDGRTLFLGNPPYVRHHQIARHWKEWLVVQAGLRGYPHTANLLACISTSF